jgi:hypothetical protein
MALAVIAMMGVRGAHLFGLHGADGQRGLNAIHDRHLHIHQHHCIAPRTPQFNRLLPI